MNESQTEGILRRLLRAGRTAPIRDTAKAELGFETRLMAMIRERRQTPESPWLVWQGVTWRLIPALAAVVIALGIVSLMADGMTVDLISRGYDPLGLEQALTYQLLGGQQ